MKSFAASAVAMLALAWTSSAAVASEVSLAKRTFVPDSSHGNAYMCTSANWADPNEKCQLVEFCVGACMKLEPKFYESVGSFGPDPGMHCLLYSDDFCGHETKIWDDTNPGNANLYSFNGKDVGHQARSAKCKLQKYY